MRVIQSSILDFSFSAFDALVFDHLQSIPNQIVGNCSHFFLFCFPKKNLNQSGAGMERMAQGQGQGAFYISLSMNSNMVGGLTNHCVHLFSPCYQTLHSCENIVHKAIRPRARRHRMIEINVFLIIISESIRFVFCCVWIEIKEISMALQFIWYSFFYCIHFICIFLFFDFFN